MAKSKIVYQLDGHAWFAGESLAFESPLEPGVYHLAAGCVELAPPVAEEGMRPRYIAGAWIQEAWSPPAGPDPAALLAGFLALNPAVMELIGRSGMR